jgi:hypothetical protein
VIACAYGLRVLGGSCWQEQPFDHLQGQRGPDDHDRREAWQEDPRGGVHGRTWVCRRDTDSTGLIFDIVAPGWVTVTVAPGARAMEESLHACRGSHEEVELRAARALEPYAAGHAATRTSGQCSRVTSSPASEVVGTTAVRPSIATAGTAPQPFHRAVDLG